ncbi:polysaccharide biosynthesis protein [Candidatus Thioglobus sp.]|nr:polysaccharide biosynthesis protein [Candidatus Thioglobus sp.]
MINKAIKISRLNKKIIEIFIDSLLLISTLLASFSIRLGYWYFPGENLIWMIFLCPIIAIPIFIRFGLYKVVIRFIGFKALWAIVQSVSLYALLWGIIAFMSAVEGIPRSIILINWVLSLLAIIGLRIFAHNLLVGNFKLLLWNSVPNNFKKNAMVYGSGGAGIQLVSALEHSEQYNIVGFIDDSKDLHGHQIKGLNIYSNDEISNCISKFEVNEILIAIPSVSRNRRLAIINELEQYPIVVRLLPSVSELAEGKISINDLREVEIKDLLGRHKVEPYKELLDRNIFDKVVLVTGAGGSIGSELCKQIIFLKPKKLILYERNELALYSIEKELSSLVSNTMDIYPILGSVNNRNRLSKVFSMFGVHTIYHAAAYKHVPLVEFNNTEGVNNNIFGTLNCAQVAIDRGVETFVLISTDKAVRPTNTMGATKRSSELILQALSIKQSRTTFSIVRFGNVLGSSGSVIPLFKKQIKDGGPLTVTDKNIFRYFMIVEEAVELVIQAGAMSSGGDVFVLDMGDPLSIDDLAKKMIRLSGLKVKDELNPDGDIEIIYTGLRPGEKLFEELLIGNNVSVTENPLIMRAEEDMLQWDELKPILDGLETAIKDGDYVKIRRLLIMAVPGFKPQSSIKDMLYSEG